MGLMNAGEVIDAVAGRLIGGRAETVFKGVSIDSRSVRKGDLFIAIVGKRLDGHDFVSEAVRKGAAGAVVSREGLVGKT
ncbi:MAG: Mur ligase domain-containing protein, partial [Acidobacteriota bacterium]